MRFAAKTDQVRRERNEDAFRINEKLCLTLIADGVGGQPAGEIASKLAIECVDAYIQTYTAELSVLQMLHKAIMQANVRVYQKADKNRALVGMATTIVACVLTPERLFVAHVGDSRAYLITRAELKRLTTDHSMIAALEASGQVTPTEAKTHPYRHVLTQALGDRTHINIDLKSLSWRRGDYLLLCTDGLTDTLADDIILRVISSKGHDLYNKCTRLIECVNARGGRDNVTVILAVNDGLPCPS
ncbi:MAG: Stp1/IreP family PP2C-type Ser/Thr phosphatase [Euryarchaeota archaeon]|nr:Stp1/IreP family PP2C-type Ser/Thr phosphatase [Euryarchaeota archaeon]